MPIYLLRYLLPILIKKKLFWILFVLLLRILLLTDMGRDPDGFINTDKRRAEKLTGLL